MLNPRGYVAKVAAFQDRPAWHADVDELLWRLGPIGGVNVLDFGCGPGRSARKLGDRGARVRGIDADCDMVAAAREFAPHLLFDQYDGSRLPYRNGQFDLVLVSHVMAHLDDPSATLTELARVTRGQGRLGVINPNWWNWILRTPLSLVTGYRSDPTARWSFTLSSFVQLAETAGWLLKESWFAGERMIFECLRSRFCVVMIKHDRRFDL